MPERSKPFGQVTGRPSADQTLRRKGRPSREMADMLPRIGRPYGRPMGSNSEQASHAGVTAAFGLTSSIQAMDTAMKMALKNQIDAGPVRSINWPPRIGPVIAAADEAK